MKETTQGIIMVVAALVVVALLSHRSATIRRQEIKLAFRYGYKCAGSTSSELQCLEKLDAVLRR